MSMNPAPKQPEDEAKSQQMQMAEAAILRRRNLLSMRTGDMEEVPSLGEILLPFLFAAMETCWISAIFIGLASFGLFGTHAPLMPLWAPFVFIIGPQWILSLMDRRAASTTANDEDEVPKTASPGSSLFILLFSVIALFIIWLTIYTPTAFFLDPSWLLALLNDIFFLNTHAYHIFFIVALILYFCWRGVRLLNHAYEPSQVFKALRLGMGIIIVVILVRVGQTSAGLALNDDFLLLLLIPIFLFLSLAAHALARVTFVRRTHPVGLEGDVSPQERSMLLIIGVMGVILLITALLVDVFASPVALADTQQVFNTLGQAYDWLAGIIASVIALIVAPLFLLIELLANLWNSLFPSRHASQTPPSRGRTRIPPSVPHASTIPAIVIFVKILFPLVLLVAAILLMRWIVRRRRRTRLVAHRRIVELRESLWSWRLFWTQFKALLLSFFRRFFPQRAVQEGEQAAVETMTSEPSARSVREIYRALLKRAAARGYPRKRDETPYEFQQRLDEKTPLAEPQLAVVTEVYTATRYGGMVPDEMEVARVRQEWSSLEQKWRETNSSPS